jgi:hypothetical protein
MVFFFLFFVCQQPCVPVKENLLAFCLQRFAVLVSKTRKICACLYMTCVEQCLTFRGEALSSLCALSQVSVLTRHQVAISFHAPCKM